MSGKAKIVVVDDDATMREALRETLAGEGYAVLAVDNAIQAIAELEKQEADLVLADLTLPRVSGLELLDSIRRQWPGLELFGHEKGAFTGADRRRIGRFEQADGGTLFLDEVCEMHPRLQAKFLRALQEREIERLGSSATIPVDTRIIAATNRDLQKALEEGVLREDLYYRLNVILLRVPPLRERIGDVPTLAMHFLRKYAAREHSSMSTIAEEALNVLLSYSWPGNVRE